MDTGFAKIAKKINTEYVKCSEKGFVFYGKKCIFAPVFEIEAARSSIFYYKRYG